MEILSFRGHVDRLIDMALDEDLGSGDITTQFLIPADAAGTAVITAKEDLVVCGLPVARRVFERVEPSIGFTSDVEDGDRVNAGAVVVRLSGSMAALLAGERTALNFLQRLSGIATHTRDHVNVLAGASARLVDTRKTTPGWRVLEKYAVRAGGAANHRMGLYDGVLIKDNHIAACGRISTAVSRIRSHTSHLVKIEVETTTLEEVREALDAGADVIMLDNMTADTMAKAVELVAGRALVEASGGVAMEDLKPLADIGIDIISMGTLTHSARAVDLSMSIAAGPNP
jgi:nicotinate-nucleotide pyrophosphorylase (carboxylating)